MNNLKKVAALILSFVLLCSINVLADNTTAEFKVSTVSGKVGDTVDVTVDMSNNPGVALIEIENNYDPTALQFISGTASANLGSNAFIVDKDPSDNIVKFTWIEAKTYSENETIYTLKFKILKEGTHNVDLNVLKVANLDEQLLPYNVTNGSVTTEGSETPANKPTFEVSNTTGKVGDTVDVNVSISNNPGVALIEIENNYDPTALQYVSGTSSTNLGSNAFIVDKDPSDNIVKFTWIEAKTYSENEIIYTLKFKILKEGTHNVDLNVLKVANLDEQVLEYNVVNGSVTTESSETPTDKPAFEVSNATGKVGDTVDVNVSISNNPGVALIEIENNYDPTALQYVSGTSSTNLGSNAFIVDKDPADNIVKFTWIEAKTYSENEIIYTLKFKILKEGTHNVDLNVLKVANLDEQVLEYTVTNGSVTGEKAVSSDSSTETSTSSSTTTTTSSSTTTTSSSTTTTSSSTTTTESSTTTTENSTTTTESSSTTTTVAQAGDSSTETTTARPSSGSGSSGGSGGGSGSGSSGGSGGGGGGRGPSSSSSSKTTTEATTEETTNSNLNTKPGTEDTTEKPVLTKDVRVTVGKKIITIGGEEFIIDAAPYIQASSNSTLVPLRFVSLAVAGEGVTNADSNSAVLWDANTKTATINIGGSIKFTAGSNIMTVNGTETTMDYGVKAEIVDGRMYIPFRALGNALGVKVDWDAVTKTAIYSMR